MIYKSKRIITTAKYTRVQRLNIISLNITIREWVRYLLLESISREKLSD